MKTIVICLISVSFWIITPAVNANPESQSTLNAKLFYAAKAGNLLFVQQLIDRGADVNAVQPSLETPLHAAASTGKVNIIKLLKHEGADPYPRTKTGWLPIHHATRFGHGQLVNYLLSTGSSLYYRTDTGQNVFDLAKATNNIKMISLLNYWKARPELTK